MPVHFNSFIGNQKDDNKIFSSIITKYTENADDIFVSKDKKNICMNSFLIDTKTNERIGKVVVTLIVRKDDIEIVDADITLLNNQLTELTFLEKLDNSSKANEYYDVVAKDENVHFQIETVNRYSLEKDNIENTKQKVSLSCFPFKLEIFDSIDGLNNKFGFAKPIKTRNTDLQVTGFSEEFMGVGSILMKGNNEPCSFVIGKIKEIKEINTALGDIQVAFTILIIDTAVGTMPVATSKENFDLQKGAVGKIVCMQADVKADFRS